MTRLSFTSPMVLTLLACDPGIHVNAHVTAANKCAAAQAQPVEDAVVTLRCSDTTTELGKTDRDGRFTYAKLGSLGSDCTLHVSAGGYVTREYRIEEACANGLVAGHCPFVNLEPVLVRSSAPAAIR